MTDFEQIKTELHKLIDGLDENKNWIILGSDKQPATSTLKNIYQTLVSMQKEPTLEEQLQELGFVKWSIHKTGKDLGEFWYCYRTDKSGIFLYSTSAFGQNNLSDWKNNNYYERKNHAN